MTPQLRHLCWKSGREDDAGPSLLRILAASRLAIRHQARQLLKLQLLPALFPIPPPPRCKKRASLLCSLARLPLQASLTMRIVNKEWSDGVVFCRGPQDALSAPPAIAPCMVYHGLVNAGYFRQQMEPLCTKMLQVDTVLHFAARHGLFGRGFDPKRPQFSRGLLRGRLLRSKSACPA